MNLILRFALATIVSIGSSAASADTANKLRRLEGYTIVLVTTITGYVRKDGKRVDSFEGCEHDRIIIFDNDKILKCNTHSYSYSYRPTAIIFSKNSDFKMLVENELYDMAR